MDDRELLTRKLLERGVEGITAIVNELDDEQVAGALGAVEWWDDMPHTGDRAVGTGLLVKKIRDGGLPGYRRPHERGGAKRSGGDAELAVSPEMLRSIRGVLGNQTGFFDRTLARETYAKLARKVNTPVDALIDSAMGSGWRVTPPHPACPQGWHGGPWEPPDPWARLRYGLWCAGVGEDPDHKMDTELLRNPADSDHEFACRYWGWQDPPELAKVIEATVALARKREEAQAAAEAVKAADAAPVTVPAAPEPEEESW